MTKSGYILIQGNKIVFVYHKLGKPNQNNVNKYIENSNRYFDDLKEYEASKREVEVENVFYWNVSKIWTFTSQYYKEFDGENVIDNQPCKAEITDNKAMIIKITNDN